MENPYTSYFKEVVPTIEHQIVQPADEQLLLKIFNDKDFNGLKYDQKLAAVTAIVSINYRLIQQKKEPITLLFQLPKETTIPVDAMVNNEIVIDSNFCIIIGEAGTGKSYVTKFICNFIKGLYRINICGACPTWRAVKVFEKSSGFPSLTIAALNGYRPDEELAKIEPNSLVFKPSHDKKYLDADLWLFDEISMMPQNIVELTKTEFAKDRFCLMLGDSGQLPPVEKDKRLTGHSSKAFDITKNVAKLWIPARQALNNPIISLARIVRNTSIGHFEAELAINKFTFKDKEFNGKLIDNTGYMCLDEGNAMINLFKKINTQQYAENPFSIVNLAYTNRAVLQMNRTIRNRLFPDAADSSHIKVGEMLRAYSSLYDEFEEPILRNSGIYMVLEVSGLEHSAFNIAGRFIKIKDMEGFRIIDKLFIVDTSEYRKLFRVYEDCYTITGGYKMSRYHEPSVTYRNNKAAWKTLKKLQQTHLLTNDIYLNPNTDEIFNLPEEGTVKLFNKTFWSAYAGTVHTAQGTTYKEVVLNYNNLKTCTNAFEQKALIYVGVTRPSNNLVIY